MIETLKTNWMRIWKEPRRVISDLVDETTPALTAVLVALFGITLIIEHASTRNMLDTLSGGSLFFISLVIGPLLGALGWLLLSLLAFGTSRLFGGVATFRETLNAVTWATIPYISKWALLFPMLLIFRSELFTKSTPIMDDSMFLLLLHVLLSVLDIAMTVLFYIILSHIIGEINGFSAWKGFFSIALIPAAVFFLLILRVILF
ncbi:YIP1 family protein [Salinithrix halophila]|uniref:YIP1 family protein n=1 Tax=Salinithrix halophila TaxID=1485204 RepID=A0ABV8JFH2_9BACL